MEKMGKFITLEGIDGAGKSTHLVWLEQHLRGRGLKIVVTREPGGTPLGEKLRTLLLDHNQAMHPETEALLMFAARREHLDKVILPNLKQGTWVLCDRFTDASFAYQGGGRGVAEAKLQILENWVQNGLQPNLTLYFDVPVEVGRQRFQGIKTPDRFEQEQEAFFRRVRQAYIDRASRDPKRFRVIDSNQPLDKIKKQLEEIMINFCL